MEETMAGSAAKGGEQKGPAMVPLLSACFAELRAKGLHEPRVFQHPTSLTEVRQLWQDICKDGLHKLKEQESPHLIAGLIVWHLKRQAEPLVPYSLYPLVVTAGAGAAEAAEAAARRAQYPGDDGQDEEDADDDDEGRDVDEDDEELDEEADRGGSRGLSESAPGSVETEEGGAQARGVGEGGAAKGCGGGGNGSAAVAKALAAVASVAKKGGFLTGHGSDGGSPNTSGGGDAESSRETSQRNEGHPVSSLMGGMAQLGIVDASGSKDGGRGAEVARSATASTTTTAIENAELHGRTASGGLRALGTPEGVSGAVATAGSVASPEGQPARGRSLLAADVMPAGSVWEQGVPDGGGGVGWGRPVGASAGGVEGVGALEGIGVRDAGTGARGLEGSKAGRGSSTGAEEGGGEWDAGDGTVALRHLLNLAAQLPYSSWQVLLLILEFLAQVAALSKVNETTTEVLAQTFAPVLCRPQGSAFMSLRHLKDLLKIQAVVRVLIENHSILSQNRAMSSNYGQAGNKTVLAGQSKAGGKDGLNLSLSAGGRRASSNDLYTVQQLINDSVSLLVYSGPEGATGGVDDEGFDRETIGEGGARGTGGGGRRRSRGETSSHQVGRLRSFLRPHMLHAPPPASTPVAAHFGGPTSLSSGSAGPAYLRKHSFFDLDEDDDDEEYNQNNPCRKQEEDTATAAVKGRATSTAAAVIGGDSASAAASSSPAQPGAQSTAESETGRGVTALSDSSVATAADGAAIAAIAALNAKFKEGMDLRGDSGGGGGTGGTVEPFARRGRKSVAGALERRRVMMACKALHAQIKHYNISFQKEYGHPPRRRERVPLVSTYAQYKTWRQFICDDASTQLQSFYRGYRERKRHPEVPRLLRKQAPPPPPPPSSSSSSAASAASPPRPMPSGAAPLSPAGQAYAPSKRVSPPAPAAAAAAAAVAAASAAGAGVGGVASGPSAPVSQAGPSSSPSAKAVVGGAPNGEDGGAGGGGGTAVTTATAADEETKAALTAELKDLLEEKRAIKSQLKDFDKSFSRRTGRVPTKAEKEPMRHLYDRYNGIKHQIRDVEGLLVTHRQQQHSPQLQFTPPQSPYTASPRGGRSTAAGPEATISNTTTANNTSNGGVSNNDNNNNDTSNPRWSTAPGTSGPSGGRAGAVVGSPISVAGAVAASTLAAAAAAASAASAAAAAGVGDGGRASGATGAGGGGAGAVGGGGGGERVEQLKREKRMLHVMLKNFEKDFKERNGREVSCPEDIKPVEADYQRYKMIKRKLAQLTET